MVLTVQAPHLAPQILVPPNSRWAALRVCLTLTMLVVAGWRDLELPADPLDAVLGPLPVDEGVHSE